MLFREGNFFFIIISLTEFTSQDAQNRQNIRTHCAPNEEHGCNLLLCVKRLTRLTKYAIFEVLRLLRMHRNSRKLCCRLNDVKEQNNRMGAFNFEPVTTSSCQASASTNFVCI